MQHNIQFVYCTINDVMLRLVLKQHDQVTIKLALQSTSYTVRDRLVLGANYRDRVCQLSCTSLLCVMSQGCIHDGKKFVGFIRPEGNLEARISNVDYKTQLIKRIITFSYCWSSTIRLTFTNYGEIHLERTLTLKIKGIFRSFIDFQSTLDSIREEKRHF